MGDNRSDATEKMTAAARDTAERMQASGQQVVESSAAIGTKILDQVEANAQEAFAAMRAAAQAKDLSQVLQIQGDYLRTQGQRSMEQAREVGQLIMQFGRAAVSPHGGTDGQG